MAWRDQLQKGSFRGAPFFWHRADSEVGRKTARHDYPLRDEAYVEDLGKLPREFTLEVYVLGPEYMAARDKLIKALEEPGPGTLVHPTMGSMKASLANRARMSESTDEGGMARFTLAFVVSSDNRYPDTAKDTAGTVATRTATAKAAASTDFTDTFSVSGFAGWIGDAGLGVVNTAIDGIGSVKGLVKPPLVPAAATNFTTSLALLKGSASSLIRQPLSLVSGLMGFVDSVSGLSDDPFAVLNGYRSLFDWGSDLKPVPRTTSNRIVQADNQTALVSLVQRSAVIEAARVASTVDFDPLVASERPTYQEATALRDEIADRLDTLMLDTNNDTLYQALADLRVAVIIDITSRGADLSRTVSWTPATTLPALVVAYALYGDAERADEVVVRNRVRHPGFVPGGRPLEVLIDA